jgi:hypothetical protein
VKTARIGSTADEALSSYETLPPALQVAFGVLLGLAATVGGLAAFAGVLFLLVTVF